MPDNAPPQSSLILYQTEDGRTRIQCRFENETIWLTQALLADLFQKDVRTINEHLVNIFEEGGLSREATIRKFRIVRLEGAREVAREVEHYSLPAILAVGYRVSSQRRRGRTRSGQAHALVAAEVSQLHRRCPGRSGKSGGDWASLRRLPEVPVSATVRRMTCAEREPG